MPTGRRGMDRKAKLPSPPLWGRLAMGTRRRPRAVGSCLTARAARRSWALCLGRRDARTHEQRAAVLQEGGAAGPKGGRCAPTDGPITAWELAALGRVYRGAPGGLPIDPGLPLPHEAAPWPRVSHPSRPLGRPDAPAAQRDAQPVCAWPAHGPGGMPIAPQHAPKMAPTACTPPLHLGRPTDAGHGANAPRQPGPHSLG